MPARGWHAATAVLVFGAVALAAIHQPNGAAETTVNVIVHYIVPVSMVQVGDARLPPAPRSAPHPVAAPAE